MTIYFDMDGTIADLYGEKNWLADLIAEKTAPYENAAPLLNPKDLCNALARRKAAGDKIGIVSWTSKSGSAEYNKAVRKAKLKWLAENMPIDWDEIHIVKYGTPKQKIIRDKNGILFDDEIGNREKWKGTAYDVKNILEILGSL